MGRPEPLTLGCSGDELESDLEGDVNRVGNIDLSLYDDDEHVGYNILGRKIQRVLPKASSALDNFLGRTDDNWRVIVDHKNQTTYRLTDRDLEIIQRVREGKLGASELNEEDFQVEYDYPLSHLPVYTYKSCRGSFVPGAEEKKIMKIVKLIKAGKYHFSNHRRAPKPEVTDLWGDNVLVAHDAKGRVIEPSLAAPKPSLPAHGESYNPSPEYLLTPEEQAEWRKEHRDNRLRNYVPKKHDCLRHVGGYSKIIQESYLRCLDLYLCPRSMRKGWFEHSSEMLPKLPSLDHFKPFPRSVGIVVKDHGSDVMALQFDRGVLAAGYRDGSIAIHNIASHPFYLPEFYARTHSTGTAYAVQTIAFHPKHPLLIFSRAQYLYVCLVRRPQTSYLELRDLVHQYWGNDAPLKDLSPHLQQYAEAIDVMRATTSEVPLVNNLTRPGKIGDWRAFRSTTFFRGYTGDPPELGDDEGSVATSGNEDDDTGHHALVQKDWDETQKFVRLLCEHNKYIVAGFVICLGVKPSAVSVHSKGAYIATAAPLAPSPNSQCLLHHLKKKRSLAPIRKVSSHGVVESVAFHPSKPYLLVGYPLGTYVYNLAPREETHIATKEGEKSKSAASVVQKFKGSDCSTAMEVVSSLAEDNTHILRVTVDGRFQWFDTDYGSLPYRSIEISEGRSSVVSVRHHTKYPLIAAGTSTADIQLFHAMEDDMSEVQINPLVKLADRDSHVTALAWNPQNHWLASGHSNGRIIVWV